MTPTARTPVAYLAGSGWVARPPVPAPPLELDTTCAVAVVGGGLGGMSAALRLAELGQDVVLLESDVCGWAASARNAGYVTATLGSDPRILSTFYKGRARAMYRFANDAVTFTEDMIDRLELECDYRPTGIFTTTTSEAAFRKLRATTTDGRRTRVASAAEAGVPATFHGGVHIKTGGTLDPGKLASQMRGRVLHSGVRVFEQTRVTAVHDSGGVVRLQTPRGVVSASQALLTTNASTNALAAAPRHLSTPVYVTAIETETMSGEQLDHSGWTSRLPLLTSHLVMESYRTTSRGTIVASTRKIEAARHADPARKPSPHVVEDLIRGFHSRFPMLADLAITRAWGGWIGMTPANMAVAGKASPRVFYSVACNGHGLPQAPYLGSLVADHMTGATMHDDLAAMWRDKPRFGPGVVNPATVRLAWVADRMTDGMARLRR